MKVIASARGTGKTEALIMTSAGTGAYIVCHSPKEASRVFGRAKEMGLRIPMPITHDELVGGEYFAAGVRGFLIDNLDLLVKQLSKVPVLAVTITTDEDGQR